MIVFFAVLGIACKMRIPEAHTLLEIVRIRYGLVAHGVWIALYEAFVPFLSSQITMY